GPIRPKPNSVRVAFLTQRCLRSQDGPRSSGPAFGNVTRAQGAAAAYRAAVTRADGGRLALVPALRRRRTIKVTTTPKSNPSSGAVMSRLFLSHEFPVSSLRGSPSRRSVLVSVIPPRNHPPRVNELKNDWRGCM